MKTDELAGRLISLGLPHVRWVLGSGAACGIFRCAESILCIITVGFFCLNRSYTYKPSLRVFFPELQFCSVKAGTAEYEPRGTPQIFRWKNVFTQKPQIRG